MKVGIIGLGDGGRCNLKSLLLLRVVELLVYDRDAKAWEAIRADMPANVHNCADFEDLLRSDVDLVIVATPDGDHLEATKTALEHGKRVFIEKPVATSLTDIDEIEALAKRYPNRMLFSEKYSYAYPIRAALHHRPNLGEFLCGSTLYTMWKCDRIMGGGKWRTESAYNPCAGGLSHNFMTALLFSGAPIVRVRAMGQVLTYHELVEHGGYDTMEGTIEFANGRVMSWMVCLAVKGEDSPYGHRTIAHTWQFENGSLIYGPNPEHDQLIVNGKRIKFIPEHRAETWGEYNIELLYLGMHAEIRHSIETGNPARHRIEQGIDVARACALAFESAKRDGEWIDIRNG